METFFTAGDRRKLYVNTLELMSLCKELEVRGHEVVLMRKLLFFCSFIEPMESLYERVNSLVFAEACKRLHTQQEQSRTCSTVS